MRNLTDYLIAESSDDVKSKIEKIVKAEGYAGTKGDHLKLFRMSSEIAKSLNMASTAVFACELTEDDFQMHKLGGHKHDEIPPMWFGPALYKNQKVLMYIDLSDTDAKIQNLLLKFILEKKIFGHTWSNVSFIVNIGDEENISGPILSKIKPIIEV